MSKAYLSRHFHLGRPASLGEYGGYRALRQARQLGPERVRAMIAEAELRGRGGAGFPAGRKWALAAVAPGDTRYVVCNADESEPGTCKDVQLLELDPHAVIEGLAIAALAVGAETAYIYLRGEFTRAARILHEALAESETHIEPLRIHMHRGAGAYICGEETALLESLEGRVGEPRLKPPYPVTSGLWGRPTLVHNVETLACVPLILAHGVAWWKGLGSAAGYGTKLFALSGDIANPGVYEAPLGIPLRELLDRFGRGPRPGREVQAVFPGGISAPPLGPAELDTPLDFESLSARGSMLGSAGVIVVDDSRCMVEVAARVMRFFAHESCGKCTPCRHGLATARELLERIHAGGGDRKTLDHCELLTRRVFHDCFCPLAKGAMSVLAGILNRFRKDFESHLTSAGCGRGCM